ncbi:MAG TPA: XdhC/CoxI family protein [Acidobacteriota bacterium]|nr:XdhC/CoxI family protein [Acidobacteriota bacterium]
MRQDPQFFHARAAKLLRSRKRFVVATLLEVKGSAPQRAGARMIIHSDGSTEFTIGGGVFEAEVIRDGLAVFGANQTALHDYKLTKNELGMYCQGLVRVFFELYRPRPQMLIFGGGHVGQALSRLAAVTDLFHVCVIDDRDEYADAHRHPFAHRVIHTDKDYEKRIPAIDSETYIVLVTRCHGTDKLLVKRFLHTPQAYLGLIGSAGKIRQFRHELSAEGIPATLLEQIHGPIGLPIGGKDPAEVAISILAEVIQTKNAKAGSNHMLSLAVKNRRP